MVCYKICSLIYNHFREVNIIGFYSAHEIEFVQLSVMIDVLNNVSVKDRLWDSSMIFYIKNILYNIYRDNFQSFWSP